LRVACRRGVGGLPDAVGGLPTLLAWTPLARTLLACRRYWPADATGLPTPLAWTPLAWTLLACRRYWRGRRWRGRRWPADTADWPAWQG